MSSKEPEPSIKKQKTVFDVKLEVDITKFYQERDTCKELQTRNFQNLENLVGTFIQLPRFEKAGNLDLIPKGYLENTKFFFSSQHYNILYNSFKEGSKSGVRVIIGPHGIGKSTFISITKVMFNYFWLLLHL